MARESDKKIAANNTSTLKLLRIGFIVSNAAQLLFLVLYRSSVTKRAIFGYVSTEALALFLWLSLRGASTPVYQQGLLVRAGDDLGVPGLTQYMLDIIYVTFATHTLSALVWRRFWWLYAAIPGYALFVAWTKLISPRLGLGKRADPSGEMSTGTAQSKRQAKLQARYESGGQRMKTARR